MVRNVVAGRGSGDVCSDRVAAGRGGLGGGGGVGDDYVVSGENSVDCAGEIRVRCSVRAACVVDVDDERGGILRDRQGAVDGDDGVVRRGGAGDGGDDGISTDGLLATADEVKVVVTVSPLSRPVVVPVKVGLAAP